MKPYFISFCCASVLLLTGCASTKGPDAVYDPIEPVNRVTYAVNKGLDKVVLRPAAVTYRFITPEPVRDSVTNFFSNIDDAVVLLNNILQWRWNAAWITTQRILLNTSFGVFGLFDAAAVQNLSKQHGDFGQTFGVWGYKKSMYFVFPLLGPSTIRDTGGTVVGYFIDPWALTEDNVELIAGAAEIVVTREKYLDQDYLLAMALDEYTFMRNAYLQRRDKIIAGETAEEVPWEEEAPLEAEVPPPPPPEAAKVPPKEKPVPAKKEQVPAKKEQAPNPDYAHPASDDYAAPL